MTHPRGDLNKYTYLQCSGVRCQVSETDLNPSTEKPGAMKMKSLCGARLISQFGAAEVQYFELPGRSAYCVLKGSGSRPT